MSARIEPAMTVADLDLMPDDENRYELFEGELFVSRAPSLSHQRVIANLIALLKTFLAQNPLGEVLPTPGVIFDFYNAAIPDLVFISDELSRRLGAGERITEAPELAVEVVSPGAENARRDRVMKRQAYGKFGVREYWIADPDNQTLEIYRLQRQTLVPTATLRDDDEISTPLLPGFACRVAQIFGK
ncbi:MAG: Uma2 family endonuclease [Pyrinomonadaceae bacterium]